MEMNQQEYDLIHRMTTESGEMWRGSQDRTRPNSEVVICKHHTRAFYLTWVGNVEGNINGWLVEVQPLKEDHEQEFLAAFGTRYYYWIGMGAILNDGKFRLRAYIKNGRKADWTISIEPCAEAVK